MTPTSRSPGQNVTFTIKVTNNGEVPLTAVGLQYLSDLLSHASRHVAAGASTDYTCVVPAEDADPQLVGHRHAGHCLATGNDSDQVDVRTPGITIDKSTSAPIIHAGGDGGLPDRRDEFGRDGIHRSPGHRCAGT